MPRFYLHMRKGHEAIPDLEGAEFESVADARDEAIEGAREIMAARVRKGKPADGSRFDIMDEDGNIVDVVEFREAIDCDEDATEEQETQAVKRLIRGGL